MCQSRTLHFAFFARLSERHECVGMYGPTITNATTGGVDSSLRYEGPCLQNQLYR